jgi:nitroreductase
VDHKAVVVGAGCVGCDQCVAVCPEGAVSVGFVDRSALQLETVPQTEGYVAPGQADAGALVRLMRSRRSVREYLPDPVPEAVLRDLIRIGTTAPSGTNSQRWTFTMLPDRDAVLVLAGEVAAFYENLNKLSANPAARLFAKLFLKDSLGKYYRGYRATVVKGLDQYRKEGRDRLFHSAPAVLLVGSKPGASCAAEDALLATQNILLAAHAMGYGTCLIGFAVEALRHQPAIKDALGIDRNEAIYSVITVGRPRTAYLHPAGRAALKPRVFRK